MTCPYCNQDVPLVSGNMIYPHRPDLAHLNFYLCRPCEAWVGCHKGTTKPLGRLANAELRKAKMAAHEAFDPLWKFSTFQRQKTKRSEAYRWLATQLGIDFKNCHIGEFDAATCGKVVEVCGKLNAGEPGESK